MCSPDPKGDNAWTTFSPPRLHDFNYAKAGQGEGLYSGMARPMDTGEDTYDVTFVNVSHPDQLRQWETQRVIRRRVMRDIGQSRRKRSRPLIVPINIPSPDISRDIPDHNGINEEDGLGSPSSFTDIGESLQPYGYFAVQPNARARQLFHFSRPLHP
jgi:hypothetical protein